MIPSLMARKLLVQAPAKLNLALSVGPPNDSGMHPISSWMVTVDLFDELHLETLPAEHFSLFATVWHGEALHRSDIDWPIDKDLVHRAHAALERHVGRELPVKCRLEKRIPVGGGLGGGSSDAAAMLRGLNELFDLRVPTVELRTIASSLGSDVPFLVDGGSAIVGGLGESIETLDRRAPIHATLLFPGVACPTGAVYKEFDRRSRAALDEARVRGLSGRDTIGPDDPFNDLAWAAQQIAPAITDDIEEIGELIDLPVHVSGSGSTLFVICSDPLHASAVTVQCMAKLKIPGVAVTTTPTPPPKPL